jgi:hypothetical protein
MNNEPVAWMSQGGDVSRSKDYFEEMGFKDLIPLYTHPVKELKNIVLASATCSCGKVMEVTNLQAVKELTDEEINEIVWQQNLLLGNDDLRKFARAILRKAQEKPASKCGDSYDTVCPPSICDCRGKEQA